MTSQLYHIPVTKNLKGNDEMHSHLVPASYHRVTAVGSAQRLSNGEQHQSIVDTLVACIQNAQEKDKKVLEGLYTMQNNARTEVKPFINEAIRWQQQAESTLQQAENTLRQMGVSLNNSNQQNNDYNY
jgi:hypothetical protein